MKRIHYAWWVFVACCVLSVVGFGLTINTASLYWTAISEDLGVTISQVSLMSTIGSLAGAAILAVTGQLFAKVDARILLTTSFALTAATYLLGAAAQDMWVLYLVGLVQGVTKTVAVSMSIAILLANWFEKQLGLVMGITGALTAVGGSIFSPMVGSWIAQDGWRQAYVLTAIVMSVTILPFTIFITRLRRPGVDTPYGYDPTTSTAQSADSGVPARRAYRSAPFVGFVVIVLLLQGVASLVQHVPTYLNLGGLSEVATGAVFSALLLGAAAGKFVIGVLLDHMPAPIALVVFALIGGGGWAGLLLVSGQSPLSVASFAAGMGQGFALVGLPLLVRRVFGGLDYATIWSTVSLFGALGNAIMVYVHGLLHDSTGGYELSLTINVVSYAVAYALVLLVIVAGRKLVFDRSSAREDQGLALTEGSDEAVASRA
ncbi:MAG: MFS transporter [Actinomyces urogenitalis]|uniref:MFS transporter n=1 Tax=Actinomyces urogenitalis TaxID=103621 RepID=UPI000660ABDA|nr:MFS transporter [Actinomyces urogenitalis]MBS6072785.1 MFS transporter [Actinomyces urogenitalis]MDU7427723.1 MFS transporter [Actinomyces urogenitalis]